MSEQTEIANLGAMVERMTRENELLRRGGDSRSRESSVAMPWTPSVTGAAAVGNAGPSTVEKEQQPDTLPGRAASTDHPEKVARAEPAATEPAAMQAIRFLEALRPLLDQGPKDRGKRIPTKGPEPFDGAHAAFRQWWEEL